MVGSQTDPKGSGRPPSPTDFYTRNGIWWIWNRVSEFSSVLKVKGNRTLNGKPPFLPTNRSWWYHFQTGFVYPQYLRSIL